MRSGSGVGVSFVCKCGGSQSVTFVRSGLCNMVSRVGTRERIVTVWAVASLVGVFVVGGEVGGGSVSSEIERSCRNSMNLLRSSVNSRLIVKAIAYCVVCGWTVCMGPLWGRAVWRYLGLPSVGLVWRVPRQ